METHVNPEDFDLYALDALDGEDRQRFEAHLRTCKECQKQLAEMQSLSALLGMTPSEVEPSPTVKERLMDNIHSEKSAQEAQGEPPRRAPARKRAHWGLRFSLGFALTTVVLALVCSWLWKMDTHHELLLSQTTAQLKKAQAEVQQTQASMQAMTKVMVAADTVQVALTHQAGTPPGSAHVYYNARMGIVVYIGVISPAPTGKSYQLWLEPDMGAPVSAGMVEANQENGAAVAHLPQGLAAKAFAVTLEPKGGKPQPSGPTVLAGTVGNG
jgi:anti-sigma-K factor RskA